MYIYKYEDIYVVFPLYHTLSLGFPKRFLTFRDILKLKSCKKNLKAESAESSVADLDPCKKNNFLDRVQISIKYIYGIRDLL